MLLLLFFKPAAITTYYFEYNFKVWTLLFQDKLPRLTFSLQNAFCRQVGKDGAESCIWPEGKNAQTWKSWQDL